VTVMAALREVIERKGLFCALYSDRGSDIPDTSLAPKGGHFNLLKKIGVAIHGYSWAWMFARSLFPPELQPFIAILKDVAYTKFKNAIPLEDARTRPSYEVPVNLGVWRNEHFISNSAIDCKSSDA
jgi:hypothetical protein